jgi:hypothetical protein
MMFGPKVRLSKELFELCKRHATETGYGSIEEFVAHTLEKEIRKTAQGRSKDEAIMAKRLQGLGYLE